MITVSGTQAFVFALAAFIGALVIYYGVIRRYVGHKRGGVILAFGKLALVVLTVASWLVVIAALAS